MRNSAQHQITSRDVSFAAPDSVTVFGTLCEVRNARIMAILMHGITTDRNEYLDFYKDLADHLAQHQISSLRFDFRGHGTSKEKQTTFSPIGQVLDLVGAVNFLNDRSDLSRARLVAFGTSFGAGPAIFTSKFRSGTFSRLYLLAPVLDYEMTFLKPRTNWEREYFTNKALAAAYKNGSLKLDQFDVGVRALAEMNLLNPAATAKELEALPIRIVHGEADSMVPIDQSETLSRLVPNISLLKMPGMDHGFNASGDDEGTDQRSLQNRAKIFEDFVSFVESDDA